MTLIIVVNAFAPLVSLCLTSIPAYHKSNAQAQNSNPYVKPTPTPLANPLCLPSLRALLSDLAYDLTAFSSPSNEYTVRICEII